jgi:hypothetical protein
MRMRMPGTLCRWEIYSSKKSGYIVEKTYSIVERREVYEDDSNTEKYENKDKDRTGKGL